MPLLNMRLVHPLVVVDVNRIATLDYMRAENGRLAIGAGAHARGIELWAEARERCPILTESLRRVGHVEFRNRGTVCGSLAHADPAAELPVVAVKDTLSPLGAGLTQPGLSEEVSGLAGRNRD